MKKFLEIGFWVTLVAFLALGAAVVFGQLIGVFALSPALVVGSSEVLSAWAFSLSTACAVFAFALQYFVKKPAGDDEGETEA